MPFPFYSSEVTLSRSLADSGIPQRPNTHLAGLQERGRGRRPQRVPLPRRLERGRARARSHLAATETPRPLTRPPHRTNQRWRRRRGGDARGGAYAAPRVSRAGGGRRPAPAEAAAAAAAAEGRRRGTRGGATGRARAARLSAAAASPQPGRRAPQRVRGL